jgi:hypothetical protein
MKNQWLEGLDGRHTIINPLPCTVYFEQQIFFDKCSFSRTMLDKAKAIISLAFPLKSGFNHGLRP